MSTTFYVDDWHKQPFKEKKVFVKDTYPSLSETIEDEEFYFSNDYATHKDKETGHYYELIKVYDNPFPEVTIGYGISSKITSKIFNSSEGCDSVDIKKLDEAQKKLFKLINTNNTKGMTEEPSYKGNFIDFGINETKVLSIYKELYNLIVFAKKHNKSIYWG